MNLLRFSKAKNFVETIHDEEQFRCSHSIGISFCADRWKEILVSMLFTEDHSNIKNVSSGCMYFPLIVLIPQKGEMISNREEFLLRASCVE